MDRPVVFITGALSGIGRATAFAFAAEGARLLVSGRRADAGSALVAELQAAGAEARFLPLDVRDETSVAAGIADGVAHFGRLDVVVNNAGVEGELGPIAGQQVGNYRHVFDNNVLGTLLVMKHALPVLQAQRSGAIVNVSSVAGQIGFAGASVYAASKHAVDGLTKSAALEAAAFGVRVNAVAPGPVQTPMLDRFTGHSDEAKQGLVAGVPLQRAGKVEEIAAAIVFLASAKAGFLTGQSVVVDGGLLAGR